MHNDIFYLIILIPFAGFIIERFLDWLNSQMWSETLPEKLIGVCDADEYKKTQKYQKENIRFGLWASLFNLAVIILMIVAGGFSYVDSIARSISSHPILVSLLFFVIIGLASDILNMPFSWYDSFVIEARYGFNTMTPKIFFADHLKSLLLAVIIGVPVLGLVTWFYYKTGSDFWLYAWSLITVFALFINFFYSELIVPLFNKQVPLPEGQLRDEIESFSKKAGFQLKNIYTIDNSKRSTKSNAYFSGFGSKKRIVLYDTLMRDLNDKEIVAVLAHEIGHYKKKHVLVNVILSVLMTGIMLFMFSLIVNNPALSKALGIENPSFHIGLVVFGILYSPVSLVIGLFTNLISRKNEFAADKFALEFYDSKILAGALKKLAVKNLSNMTPHPAYVFFHYSHPPLLERIKRLE